MKPNDFQQLRTLALAALLLAACNQATPEPQLVPTRTLAPRVTAASVQTSQASQASNAPAASSTMPLTGLTLENAGQLKPIFEVDEPPPQHIYSVAEGRLTLYNSRAFEVVDSTTLAVKARTAVQINDDQASNFWYAASPNGKWGAIMQMSGAVDIYDLDTGKITKTLTVPQPSMQVASDIALSQDGSELVVISQGVLQRINVAGARRVGESQTLPQATQYVRFSEDASRVAAVQTTGDVVIVNAISGNPPITLTSPFTTTGIQLLNFSPNGTTFGASGGDALVVWDLSANEPRIRQTFTDLGGAVEPVFNRSGRFMAALAGTTVFLYDLQTQEGKGQFRLAGNAPIWSANFDPDGKTLFLAGSGELASFSVAETTALQSATRLPVSRGVFTADGKALLTWSTVYQSGDVARFDAQTGEVRGRLIHNAPVAWVMPDAMDKYVATLTFDREMQVWRTRDGELSAKIAAPITDTARTMLCFTPDGRNFVYLDGKRVILHDIERDRETQDFELPFAPNFISGCNNDKGILAAAGESAIRLFDLDGQSVATLNDTGDLDRAGALYLSKDGNRVAALSQTRLTIWDVATQKELQMVRLQRDPLIGAFSPRSDKFALNFGDDVDVLDVASGKLVSLDLPPGSSVTTLFPQDSRIIVTVAMIPTPETADQPFDQRVFMEGELDIWDLRQTGQLVRKIETEEALYSAAISDDGSRIVTSTRNNAMTVWGMGN